MTAFVPQFPVQVSVPEAVPNIFLCSVLLIFIYPIEEVILLAFVYISIDLKMVLCHKKWLTEMFLFILSLPLKIIHSVMKAIFISVV
jgi:hypothetical protein